MCNGILMLEGREIFRVEVDSNLRILEAHEMPIGDFGLDEAKILREQIWEDEVSDNLLEEMILDEVLV